MPQLENMYGYDAEYCKNPQVIIILNSIPNHNIILKIMINNSLANRSKIIKSPNNSKQPIKPLMSDYQYVNPIKNEKEKKLD